MYQIDLKLNNETNKWEIKISTSEATALKSTEPLVKYTFDTKDEALAKEVFDQILEALNTP